jgi:hypothetical protein
MVTLQEIIYKYVSKHEAQLSSNLKNGSDNNIDVHFTRFGTTAACKAIYDIIDLLDNDNKIKVIEVMKNKRIM